MPASGSDSRSNIRGSIYQLVVGSQAYRRDRSVGWTVGVAVIVWLGSSTVPATGLFGWQCNASNGVVFVGVSARILVFVRRRIGTASCLSVGVLARQLSCS